MKYTYLHTIENISGEILTFLRRVESPEGDCLEVENRVKPKAGPPMHVHHKQSESLTVIKGKIGIQRPGGKPEYYGEGETLTFEAGDPHKFWNAGTEELICRGWAKPANNIEYFLEQIFKSMNENGGTRPGTFDGAYLMKHFKTEFDMLEIPPFVKKVIFPVTIFLGKLAGKHKKFKDAPDAVK
jgi:quercetin dioxygenase-like cupin family protein